MTGISAQNAEFNTQILFTEQNNTVSVDMSEAMWRYKNLNKIGDCPVEQQAQNLPLDSIDKIQRALVLQTTVKTWTGYLSPKEEDKQSVQQYNKIQQGLIDGSLSFIDQQKHFCSDLGKIMILITYGQLQYKLNQRYKYLKGQIDVVE